MTSWSKTFREPDAHQKYFFYPYSDQNVFESKKLIHQSTVKSKKDAPPKQSPPFFGGEGGQDILCVIIPELF